MVPEQTTSNVSTENKVSQSSMRADAYNLAPKSVKQGSHEFRVSLGYSEIMGSLGKKRDLAPSSKNQKINRW